MHSMRSGAVIVFALAAVCIAACGAMPGDSYVKSAPESEPRNAYKDDVGYMAPATSVAGTGALALAGESKSLTETKENTLPAAAPRKIIYTGQLNLVVKDLTEFDKQVVDAATKSGGYVSKIKEDRTYGDQRTGHWVLRVPANRFQTVIDELAALGVAQMRQVDSQDVTEEYVDLDGRIATKKKLLERLDKLLAEKTGDVKDVLAVQNELFRVQEELERMQGRLKYLADQTTFTTITVDAREDREYEPPAAPTFSTKVSDSWTHSFTSLVQFGENLVLAVVALTPWLVSGIILIGVPVGLFRWRRRSRRAKVVEARIA